MFRAPRTTPLVLVLLSDKKLCGKSDAGRVYLELLARHWSTGIVEMASPGEHSYACGYTGTRGVRTWLERMKLLDDLGFIKSQSSGNQQYKYVLLVHPTIAVKALHDKSRISKDWWNTYRQRQIEATEPPHEQLIERHRPPKVVPMKSARGKAPRRSAKTAA